MRQCHRFFTCARASLCCLSASTVMLLAADVGADGATPIEITLLGPRAVRVRLASGTTFPCDSGNNRPIIEGKFSAGEVLRASTPDWCVCFQQTYEPFSDIDWSAPALVCRPLICTRGRRRCLPSSDPTIRLRIRSERPQ
jgi:hypothetical protein